MWWEPYLTVNGDTQADSANFVRVAENRNYLNPVQTGFSGAAHGWGAFLALKSATHIIQWWNWASYTLPKEDLKIYESRDTSHEFCWRQGFFTGNQQILLCQDIQI